MGEVTDLILEGVLCEVCGSVVNADFSGDGFPCMCPSCTKHEGLAIIVSNTRILDIVMSVVELYPLSVINLRSFVLTNVRMQLLMHSIKLPDNEIEYYIDMAIETIKDCEEYDY